MVRIMNWAHCSRRTLNLIFRLILRSPCSTTGTIAFDFEFEAQKGGILVSFIPALTSSWNKLKNLPVFDSKLISFISLNFRLQ